MGKYYAGPGSVYFGTIGFQPEGANGAITAAIEEKTSVRGSAQFGDMFETADDASGKVTFVPFDSWSLLPVLFPAYLGVTTSAGAGSLAVGTNPFDPTNANISTPCGVWTSDTRLYDFVRGAITKHPNLKFLPGAPLFGSTEITAFGDLTKSMGDNSFLVNANAITETGAASPITTNPFAIADYGQSHWTAAWGAINGFVGMEAEDG